MPRTDQLIRPWWLLPVGRVAPLWWLAIAAGLIWIEYLVGPDFEFPVLYVIPVCLAAWYSGRRPSMALALTIPAAHILFLLTAWAPIDSFGTRALATLFRGSVIFVMGQWIARLAEHERVLERHVQRLEGLLPICAFCKSIRTEAGVWEPLEAYISTRSEAQFSHGLCPPCGRRHYPGMVDDEPAAS